jgi:UDP-N-acetylglucosamine 1-carboxyvinyltransferase
MPQLEIEGGYKLSGVVRISGAKNNAVAIIPAAILADDIVTVANVPDISDTAALTEILEFLGAKIKRENELMIIDPTTIENKEISENESKKLRASYYFMGALLGKYKKVQMFFPGGCSLGPRPINLHLKGFEALGAKIQADGNKYSIEAEELVGNNIYLDIASVGATINIMLAAVKAKGVTVIENAAKEPEIVNVAIFLNNMGANISGAGTSEIKIVGVDKLHGCFHEIIPDRIEAGTFAIMGALLGDNMRIENIIPGHLDALMSKLAEIGIEVQMGHNYCIINKAQHLKSTNIKTMVYPGFPTDLQQPITALLTQCDGESVVQESIFESRFNNISYLNEMGANITTDNDRAYIKGPTPLYGKVVDATDLRAGACLIIAGLIASGKTTINNIEHVLRGYEQIVEKLTNLGAKITLK